MKQPKKLTKKIKQQMTEYGLNNLDWLLLSETKDDYTLIHKHDSSIYTYPKQDLKPRRQKTT